MRDVPLNFVVFLKWLYASGWVFRYTRHFPLDGQVEAVTQQHEHPIDRSLGTATTNLGVLKVSNLAFGDLVHLDVAKRFLDVISVQALVGQPTALVDLHKGQVLVLKELVEGWTLALFILDVQWVLTKRNEPC